MAIAKKTDSEHNAHRMRISGMKCPVCEGFIPISVQQLLFENGVSCPQCGQSFIINKVKSKQALEALMKVEDAVQNLRNKEHFIR